MMSKKKGVQILIILPPRLFINPASLPPSLSLSYLTLFLAISASTLATYASAVSCPPP
jgi:hypothetical protein